MNMDGVAQLTSRGLGTVTELRETLNGVDGQGLPPDVRNELFELYSAMRGSDDDYEPDILAEFIEMCADLHPTEKPMDETRVPLGPRPAAVDEEVGIHPAAAFDIVFLTSAGYCAATVLAVQSLLDCAPHLHAGVTVYCTDRESAACLGERFGVTTRVWRCGPCDTAMCTYRTRRFNQIASLKSRIMYAHLSRDRLVLYSDGDVVWRADPSLFVAGLMEGGHALAMAEDRAIEHETVACTGVIAARPCTDTTAVFGAGQHPPWCGDQASINHALATLGVQWQQLPPHLFDHHNGLCGEAKMRKLGASTADLQDSVHVLSAEFRPPSHTNTGYSGPWVENAYYAHWLSAGAPADDRVYLPVFWTDVQVTAPQMLGGLAAFLEGLPAGEYYTVIQHARGPGVAIPRHVRLKTFCAGWRCDADCHVIPLLKRELALGRVARDIPVSFTGTCGVVNDVDGVRSRALAAFAPHGLVSHHGRGWEEVLCRSRFALCPRGFGPTSFRLSEAVQAGAIPIVIWSRQLVMPDNITRSDWSVVLHVDELDTERGRGMLAEMFADTEGAEAMSRAVREVRDAFTYEQVSTFISTCVARS